jgi:hypothetical protein
VRPLPDLQYERILPSWEKTAQEIRHDDTNEHEESFGITPPDHL